ncbi:MAG TPA: hypothetical protein QGI03_09110 [Dehalococcoidia bacterium]|nr:hypothetical protein [Dehalococcoidia bacterium]
MEKNGTPAIGIFTEAFERDARASCRAIGVPFLPLALVPTILSNEPPDTIRGYGEAIYPKVVEAFTKVPTGPGATSTQEAEEQEALTFHGDDLLDAAEAMNRTLVEYNWSDGFPLVPPTGSRVDRMLAGTQKPRDQIVAVLEPGFGLATVEKIAINAVMAGCQPGHLPVLIAAVEAMADPYYRLRAVSCSTGPHAPLLVINGPVAKELKVNSGLCCFGPGGPSYANTVIGRAVRLIMMNIGHARPTDSDMDTHGMPHKYSACIAEAEGNSPWIPLHVSRGYNQDTSTVTVFVARYMLDINDAGNYTPEHILRRIAIGMSNGASVFTGHWLAEPRIYRRTALRDRDSHKMYDAHCLVIIGSAPRQGPGPLQLDQGRGE